MQPRQRNDSTTRTDRHALARPALSLGHGPGCAPGCCSSWQPWCWDSGEGYGARGDRGPLLAFDRDRVTGIRIEVPDAEPVLVAKTDNGWVIPALGDLPAAEHKVTELLSKLEGLEKGLPVATSDRP